MLVVNLFGAPGAGKSTLALLVAGLLKTYHPDLTTECPDEIAKIAVYDEAHKVLSCQINVAGRQYWQVARCQGHADVVVTDSPILLSVVYGTETVPPMPPEFAVVCKHYHDLLPSLSFYVERTHAFERRARIQNEEGAALLGEKIKTMLTRLAVPFRTVHSDLTVAAQIADEAAALARRLKD